MEPLCCVCGDMWGTLSPPYSCVTRLRRGGGRLNHSVSRSMGVSLLIRYHVEQGRGRALSGSGRPLDAPLRAGQQQNLSLRGLHVVAAAQDPSDLEFFTLSTAPAWFADTRISLCASLRLPARRLLRARREAHPIGDRIEAPVQARQRRRRCPPASPQHDAAHCATRSAHMPQGGVFTLPSEFLLPAGRETSASLLPG